MSQKNILELDVTTLFEQYTVQDLKEIEKQLDSEIEKKRTELRSMLGFRYKDILTATEAIKSIEHISEGIVTNLNGVLEKCDNIVNRSPVEIPKKHPPLEKDILEERAILIQIRLAVDFNEFIYQAIDDNDYCRAAQIYLLAQYVHTSLALTKIAVPKYRLLKRLKTTLDSMRNKILDGSINSLKNIFITTEETCKNLNAILLLENCTCSDLLKKFIDLRKTALKTVIDGTYPSVRNQISAMLRCLYVTIQLLHDCFLSSKSNEGQIWQELELIVGENAPPTLSKFKIHDTKLNAYIPQVIEQFRPKCSQTDKISKPETIKSVKLWLEETCQFIKSSISNPLHLVSNVKGLHNIREEALKTEIPENFDDICEALDLPKNFKAWYHFMQESITNHARKIISSKITSAMEQIKESFAKVVEDVSKTNEGLSEIDIRWFLHASNAPNEKDGEEESIEKLSLKTRGISPHISNLCETLNAKFELLLSDFSLYVYGKSHEKNELSSLLTTISYSNNVDRQILESHLKQECINQLRTLLKFLENNVAESKDNSKILKSILSARFLTGLMYLCSSLKKCCMCDNSAQEWETFCSDLNKCCFKFWDNWIDSSCQKLQTDCTNLKEHLKEEKMLHILCRWDNIEIQEQTEESTFKSQIKIPMKCSLFLAHVLDKLCDMLNAVLPFTLYKQVHLKFIERTVLVILEEYENVLEELQQRQLNQTQALQFLFDIKFLTTLCVPKENMALVQKSQLVSNKYRAFVDPFDLDVFYKYLQHNVRQSALQSQVILGCLLPSSSQLAALGQLEKNKEHEKEPSILGLSVPSNNSWFVLLPVSEPTAKAAPFHVAETVPQNNSSSKSKKASSNTASVRSGAAALFGAMTNDWFS